MHFAHNGSVKGLPSHLTCGRCGGRSGVVKWEVMHNGEDHAGVGLANCMECGSALVGLVANTDEVLAYLMGTVSLAYGDDQVPGSLQP